MNVQRAMKRKIEFNTYVPSGKLKRVDYATRMLGFVRDLNMTIGADLIIQISAHFDRTVRQSVICQKITTSEGLIQILADFDAEDGRSRPQNNQQSPQSNTTFAPHSNSTPKQQQNQNSNYSPRFSPNTQNNRYNNQQNYQHSRPYNARNVQTERMQDNSNNNNQNRNRQNTQQRDRQLTQNRTNDTLNVNAVEMNATLNDLMGIASAGNE